jgi:hypothetical protein
MLGICCCIVPGVYLFVAWLFSLPLVMDKRLEFWSAMEASRRVVTRVWFEVFGLFLVAFLPTLLMFFFLQLKVTLGIMPAMQSAMPPGAPLDFGHLMQVILELSTQPPPAARISPALALAFRLVLLFNLPFALGALLHAYENLFGTRHAPTP